jgi:hypothetical protein
MAVFVPASAGISYENQTGGFACLPRQIEGYYVPVFNQLAYESLRSIFEVTLGGSGTYRGVVWEGKMRDDLGEAVAECEWTHRVGGPIEVPLVLDESRLLEIDEAWVPVISPDDPGVLIWENSD